MENLGTEVPEHVQLSMYNKKFSKRALKEIKSGTVFPFMRLFPGEFKSKNKQVVYVDSLGIERTLVPHENMDEFVEMMYRNTEVPKGQNSFAEYIHDRYIGPSTIQLKKFIQSKTMLQLIRDLPRKQTKGVRIVRPLTPFRRIGMDIADMISLVNRYKVGDLR